MPDNNNNDSEKTRHKNKKLEALVEAIKQNSLK